MDSKPKYEVRSFTTWRVYNTETELPVKDLYADLIADFDHEREADDAADALNTGRRSGYQD